MNYKAVFWDFGGVITTSPFEAFARYEQAHELPKGAIRSINAHNPDSNAWAQLERSSITPEAFDKLFAQEARARGGWDIPGSDVLSLLAGSIRPQMLATLQRLKADGYAQLCITNNVRTGEGAGMARAPAQAKKIADVMALFDIVLESSKLELRKPDPKIYTLACDMVKLPPAQVVFLDDLGINLKPARAMGMATIKVVDEAQARQDLARHLGYDSLP